MILDSRGRFFVHLFNIIISIALTVGHFLHLYKQNALLTRRHHALMVTGVPHPIHRHVEEYHLYMQLIKINSEQKKMYRSHLSQFL